MAGAKPLNLVVYQHPIPPKDGEDMKRWEKDHRKSMDALVSRLNELLQPDYVPPTKEKQL